MTVPSNPVAEMFEKYRDRLRAFVVRNLPPELSARLDADDVLQEAWKDATADYARYLVGDQGMSEYVWLYLKVKDRLAEIEHAARAQRRDVGREAWRPDASSFAFEVLDSATGPVSAAQREEVNMAFHSVLDQLDPEDREVLWLRTFDELSHAEIGELLAIKENTAAVRYHRAVKAFATLWRQRFPHWSAS